MNTKIYVFLLDYGSRSEEKEFIKDILRNFDNDTVVGCGIFVNNNPYNLELLLFVSIEKEIEKFENFIKQKYSRKKRVFNYFMSDIFEMFSKRGYNSITFRDENSVDLIMTDETKGIFLFPSRSILQKAWGDTRSSRKNFFKVFLSHSSKDKKIVDEIFNNFQINEISAWYDKYQIEAGDSITDKINEGLDESDIGIICISKNFLNSQSGWTKSELNYFIQRRMRNSRKNFLIVNFDVPHDELPPLVQDYRYIDFSEKDAMQILMNVVKKQLEKQ